VKLLVLAGGFGTRLKSAVHGVPKALAPVGGVPFLKLQLEHWVSQGIRSFCFLLHHQAGLITEFLDSEKLYLLKECDTDWLIESVPMNTGGAIANAVRERNIKDSFLVTNADTWLGNGMYELSKNASPSLAVVHLQDISRYGQVEFTKELQVSRFIEKTGEHTAGWINAGIFHLDSELFEGWNGQPFSLERVLLPQLVGHRGLKAIPLETDFIDIGIPADYHRFCAWIENGRVTPL
jgi:D-glycero-alpha-D-manno-heptose 1-phosphate guanylyltransferase